MRTVLLAYERDQDVAAVETLLEARGLVVKVARSGLEALEMARRESPHVVVSDVMLPKLDGFALCRRLREDPLLAHLPVLLHSFRVEGPKYEAFAAEVGAHRFFPRGSTLEDVVVAVEEQMTGSGTMRMPALVPELLERRETDRRRLGDLERRVQELEAANRELATAERVAREAAEAATRDRDLATRQRDEVAKHRDETATQRKKATRDREKLSQERDDANRLRDQAARELADALRDRDEAVRAEAESRRVLQEKLVDAETRLHKATLELTKTRDAALGARADQQHVAALEGRLSDLQASRARAQAAAIDAERAFAAQPVPTWLVDMETHEIRAASDSAATLFGMPRESLVGRSMADLLPNSAPGDDPAGVVTTEFLRAGQPPVSLELRFRSVSFDGRACWITSARDLSPEHAARAATAVADQRSMLLERAPFAACVADELGRIRDANAAFRELLGLESSALASATLQQFDCGGDGEDTVRSAAIGTPGPALRHCRWQRADGSSFDAELSIDSVEGPAALRIVAVRDVSSEKLGQARAARDQRGLSALLDLAQRSHSLTEAEILSQSLELVCELTDSAMGYAFLALAEPGQLELAAMRGEAPAPDLPVLRRWRGAPPAGTALAQCLAEQVPVTRDASETSQALRQAGLPETFQRQLCVPIPDGGRTTGALLLGDRAGPYDADERRYAMLVADALARLLKRRRSDAEIVSAMDHMERVMLGVVESVATLAETQDAGRSGRARRIAELAAGIGTALGLPGHTVRGLRVMGQLIDVGMLHIPREILWRPGQLTPAEFELVKTHTERGHEILHGIEFPWPVAEVVRQHHERLDGSGYPRGLAGDAILLEARIVAVADAAEAMLAQRPQRSALSVAACIEELQSQAGRRYDARVIKACVKLLRERETRTEGGASVGQRIA
jgi:PAS domain S-box-containing protein